MSSCSFVNEAWAKLLIHRRSDTLSFPFRDHAAHNPAGQRINIFIERLWRSLKQEAVYLHESQGGFQAKRVIKDWLSFYNTERPHTALDKQTPEDAFFDTERSQKAA
ncbi:integrase core domain-containing protein [Sulfitobacter sp. M13]